MLKKYVVLLVALLVFSVFASGFVFAVHGVKICGKNYDCGVDDGVCPEDYGADCSADPDVDCASSSGHCVGWACNRNDADSDNGDKPLVAGHVVDYSCVNDACVASGPYYDSCSGNTLTEYFLSSGGVSSKTYDCDGNDSPEL